MGLHAIHDDLPPVLIRRFRASVCFDEGRGRGSSGGLVAVAWLAVVGIVSRNAAGKRGLVAWMKEL